MITYRDKRKLSVSLCVFRALTRYCHLRWWSRGLLTAIILLKNRATRQTVRSFIRTTVTTMSPCGAISPSSATDWFWGGRGQTAWNSWCVWDELRARSVSFVLLNHRVGQFRLRKASASWQRLNRTHDTGTTTGDNWSVSCTSILGPANYAGRHRTQLWVQYNRSILVMQTASL
jgi:hypothetical protein